jgi:hypothetical protein
LGVLQNWDLFPTAEREGQSACGVDFALEWRLCYIGSVKLSLMSAGVCCCAMCCAQMHSGVRKWLT